LKYSKLEKIKDIKKIKHPIIREVLLKYKFNLKRIEITTLADIPAGTGLGSSGSFTNSLIKALYAFNNRSINTERLSEESCDIEINRLKNPVGKQDQYISAYGGIKNFIFKKNNKVIVSNTKISRDIFFELEDNLLLFFTGFTRSSSTILKKQDVDSKKNIYEMIENLKNIKKMGLEAKKLIENNDLKKYGELMNYHWRKKIERSKNITNKKINYLYEEALKNGAIGGKLVGAGGGGFLMFYADDKTSLRKKMLNLKVEELKFKFDTEGTKII
jgi:D-glycero-alpha-D-manno-heptose-7-phosphate kinase